MSGTEEIDIEALLARAYRDKAIDRLGGGNATRAALGLARGPRAPGSTMGGAERVDTSSYAARMAAEMRDMLLRLANAPDALLALHDAVLALPDFFVEIRPEGEFLVWDAETAASMGQRLDPDRELPTITRLRRRGGSGENAADLIPVGAPRRLLRVVTTLLVITHARNTDRPLVSEHAPARWRPIYRGADKRAAGHEPEYETPVEVVALERATYMVWRTALTLLAGLALSGYRITGPAAPEAPWTIPQARIVRGLAPRPEANKALARKRKPAAKRAKKRAV